MSNNLEHPVLYAAINGTDVPPASFHLDTDEGIAVTLAQITFPAETEIGKPGDEITVRLSLGDKEHLLFTGSIFIAEVNGAYRSLSLSDSYIKLYNTYTTPAYRKEKAQTILQDTLDAAGIKKTSITCPPVEIARFSTDTIPSCRCIQLLITALEEHGHTGLRYFFDAEDTFHFGTIDDAGKNEGEKYEFVSKQNILKKTNDRIEVLPLPIRHSQTILVDDAERIVTRSNLAISGRHSRLTLWLREAG